MSDNRTPGARVGIVLLNLLWPGLGVLRTGAIVGFAWMATVFGLIGLYFVAAALLPQWSLATYYVVAATLVLGGLVNCVGSMIVTWRRSRTIVALPFFSRWYGLLLVYMAAQIVLWPALPFAQSFYKLYFAPSSSMAPSIDIGDNFLVDLRRIDPVRTGDIVVFRTPSSVYIKRVVALPGQRVAMHQGVPIIDGQPARQVLTGRSRTTDWGGRTFILRESEETLPGEQGRHLVFDAGEMGFDEVPEQVVPPGHFFVLGDNRDNSEDSRMPPETGGVGMVRRDALIGKPLFIYLGANRGRILTSVAAGVEPPLP